LLWDQLDGLDEQYVGGNFEDVSFCWSVREAGWKVVYQPKSTLYHYEHGSGTEWVDIHSNRNMKRLLSLFSGMGSDEYLFDLPSKTSTGVLAEEVEV